MNLPSVGSTDSVKGSKSVIVENPESIPETKSNENTENPVPSACVNDEVQGFTDSIAQVDVVNSQQTQDLTIEKKPCPTTIKHIIISGGGEYGFVFYSALRESHRVGFWNIHNIETIYGSSIGSLAALWVSLAKSISFDTYDDFIMHRPWHKVFDFHINKIIHLIKQKGMFNKKLVEVLMSPIFNAVDIPLDINMLDYYHFTNIELHLMVSNMTTMELLDVSYKTCPEWKVLDALYASMGLPILFEPYIVEGNVYADGGFINNYPTDRCIENGANPDEIFGLVREAPLKDTRPSINTLFDYLYFIIGTMLSRVCTSYTMIKNQILFPVKSEFVSIYDVYRATSSKETRAELFEIGRTEWNAFYAKTYSSSTPE